MIAQIVCKLFGNHPSGRQLSAHLKNVAFPSGTTYELLLNGPDNIFVNYPITKASSGQIIPNSSEGYSDTFYPNATYSEDHSRKKRDLIDYVTPCIMDDLEVLINRLKETLSSLQPIPESLYGYVSN